MVEETLKKYSSEQRDFNSRGESVYYLELPKSKIYQKMKEDHPRIKMSISSFYKLCSKNFKKATKKTDYCPICKSAIALAKKINHTNYTEDDKEVCRRVQDL